MAEKNTQNGTGFKTRQQIAIEYGIDRKTLKKKLDQIGISLPSGLLSTEWQKRIYETLGYPSGAVKKDFEDL